MCACINSVSLFLSICLSVQMVEAHLKKTIALFKNKREPIMRSEARVHGIVSIGETRISKPPRKLFCGPAIEKFALPLPLVFEKM